MPRPLEGRTVALAEGGTATILTTEGLAGLATEAAALSMMANAAQGAGQASDSGYIGLLGFGGQPLQLHVVDHLGT